MRAIVLASLSSAAMLFAGSAMAGGLTAPVVESRPLHTAASPMLGDWSGAYAGGALGYVLGTDDQVSLALIQNGEQTDRAPDLGDLGISGATVGVHAGYRWQRGRWAFGPELGAEFGSVDEDISFSINGVNASATSEMNTILTLVMKAGYTVNPKTLIYGAVGVARGDFDYTLRSETESITQGFTISGPAAGLGAERMISDRISIFGEYQHRGFGKETVNLTGFDGNVLSTRASMTMSTVKIGANFKF